MTKNRKKTKILLTGGGTAGSVAPLLALHDDLRGYDFVWLGTWQGIEKQMVIKENIRYFGIFSGKVRRYNSWRNFIDPVLIILGFFQSLIYLAIIKPNIIITAGSFVSVPVVLAGRILRIPVLVHQLDYRPGIANRIMGFFAEQVTTSLEKSLEDYPGKSVWTGSPIRQSFRDAEGELVGLKKNYPVLLVIGGGTGARGINNLVEYALDDLTEFCQIVHLTGRGKMVEAETENYYSFEFFDNEQMARALASADLIISRAGMGILTELAFLKKASLIIPMPKSHQEDNAGILEEYNAAIVMSENELSRGKFIQLVKDLLANEPLREELGNNLNKVIKSDGNHEIINIIKEIVRNKEEENKSEENKE
ncbi:MAG: UDP-N-acetylglucosamine--N-acetylmuramyl-(pentapeptide) pyrophosphoryl-undecaprenol N-acetylglucosamine transferase [bacterium]